MLLDLLGILIGVIFAWLLLFIAKRLLPIGAKPKPWKVLIQIVSVGLLGNGMLQLWLLLIGWLKPGTTTPMMISILIYGATLWHLLIVRYRTLPPK